MRTIALLLFAAGIAPAAEPRFQVENKTTPFTVVNKTAPKNYVPPPCAQCNTGNNQCACPLHYGTCRCGELNKAPAQVVPASRPFPAGYPGFSNSTRTTPAHGAGLRSSSSSGSYPMGNMYTPARGAFILGGTSGGCLTGG